MADGQQLDARNWAQARDAIDSGATGDKVANPDPATTPLGTDAEAGGASTPPDVIAQNVRNEQLTRPDPDAQPAKTGTSAWIFVAAGAVGLLVVVLFAAI